MVPTGLSLDKIAIQEEPAVVVQTGDQMPLLASIRGPFMMGRIVLDEFPDVIGQHFPVMGLPFGPGHVKIMLLGLLNDRREGNLLPVFLFEDVPDVAVVVGLDRDLRIFDQPLFLAKLMEDVLFNLWSNLSWAGCPLISDGKPGWIFPISLEQLKEPAAADPQDAKDMLSFDLPIEIPSQQRNDLLVPEGFVKMFGHDKTSCSSGGLNQCPSFSPLLNFKSSKNSPLSNFK
jgi:hypothetical protein